MAGSRVAAAALVVVLSASAAEAQSFNFTGLLTGQVGVVSGGDASGVSAAPGFSLAVLDMNGVGAEIDVAHATDLDSDSFAESSITSGMLNFTSTYPFGMLRPYVVAGAGLIRARVAPLDGGPSAARTELGWNAGGGVIYMRNEWFGVRGDVRYFRHLEQHADLSLGGTLDYWRTSVGVTFAWPLR